MTPGVSLSDPDDPLPESFERYLHDTGKGRGGDSGNYRRNAARELNRFYAWLTGTDGPASWTGITTTNRVPAFGDLDERVFREYARYLSRDRNLKQNTVKTYYAYISAWCGWCVNEGYLDAHYARRASATAPLPADDGRKPGDQQAWTPTQRHALTRYVDDQAHTAIERFTTLPDETAATDREQTRYIAIRATRDRALVYLVAYTGVRIGELLRDPNDPRRRGVRWGDLDLEDGSMEVYRKKQQWDLASLPAPVISPVRSYRRVLSPPTDRWPVFPTLDHRTLAELVRDGLSDRGLRSDVIAERRAAHHRDLFLALVEDIRPPSLTTDGARRMLRRLTADADVAIEHPKHEYLAPHGGRRGMGEVLVRAFGYTVAARYLDNSEEMVRDRYSHIEAGELGDVATEALADIDGAISPTQNE